jgi:hypothetical protein
LKAIDYYRGFRRDCNLLISQGHIEAWHYPLGFMINETHITRQRLLSDNAQNTILLQLAIASNFSKRAGGRLKTVIEDMLSWQESK